MKKEQKNYIKNQYGDTFTREEYREFMFNEHNEFLCSCCPENKGYSNPLPCGQQNCWVTIHAQ